jgi:hypothetical protein
MAKKKAKRKPRAKTKRLAGLLETTYSREWSGGRHCFTCRLKRAEDVNSDVREFAEAKGEGHAMPWQVFLDQHIRPTYGYKHTMCAFRSHAKNCLGISFS